MEALSSLLSWQSIVVTILLYYVTLALYRLYLHPLAWFPGPKLAAVTRLYEGYYDLYQSGQYSFKIAELHKHYGEGVLFPRSLIALTHTLPEQALSSASAPMSFT
jgi:hypothetical protein